MMGQLPTSGERIALVLPSVMASGTERRLSFVYRHLERRYPGVYLLIVSADIYAILNRGGFGLDRLPGVRVLQPRARIDFKTEAHASALVNLGRLATMLHYRSQLQRLIRTERITILHPYLELVPFLALAPITSVPWIVPIVDHLPKYFDGKSLDCRLLLRAVKAGTRVDCLYRWISDRLQAIGVDKQVLNNPAWNCVNHDAFHPQAKDPVSVSFASRVIDWKNPMLMVEVIDNVLRQRPDVRFSILGSGRQAPDLEREIAAKIWAPSVRIGYLEDPSSVVNRSLVHVSLDRYDNFSNQALLEGMAAGCAVVASDVGETHQVVTPEIGLTVSLKGPDLAEAILQLIDDPDHAQALGRAGRQRVMEYHHVDRYIDYLRMLHDLTRTGRVVDGVPAVEE